MNKDISKPSLRSLIIRLAENQTFSPRKRLEKMAICLKTILVQSIEKAHTET